jgi:hypothetical protein
MLRSCAVRSSFVPVRLFVLAVAPLAAVLVWAGCGGRPVPLRPWHVVAPANLAQAAAAAEGHACSIAGENLSGRGDPAACGPFPCEYGKCRVSTCDGTADHCYPGFCSQGYCLRPEPHGTRSCAPAAKKYWEGDAATWAARAGCQCLPQNATISRDQETCGSFPCGIDGCYVKQCDGDGDCEYGLCSGHGSRPHGYCVTDDAY